MPSEMIEGRAGMWDADVRVQEITREGVDQEILFPQRMLGVIRNEDFDYIQACMDAYNEMLAEFSAEQPDRLHGLALLNYWNPEATEDELQKIKALGFKGVLMPSLPPPHAKVYYNARALEPMWKAIGEVRPAAQLPRRRDLRRTRPGRSGHDHRRRLPSPSAASSRCSPSPASSSATPDCKVIFTEGGISWVPSALFDCDKVYASFESEMTPKLAKPPSHYWFENCYATFIEDPSRPAPTRPDRRRQGPLGLRLPASRERRRLHPAIHLGRLRRHRLDRRRPEDRRRKRPEDSGASPDPVPTSPGRAALNKSPPRRRGPRTACPWLDPESRVRPPSDPLSPRERVRVRAPPLCGDPFLNSYLSQRGRSDIQRSTQRHSRQDREVRR